VSLARITTRRLLALRPSDADEENYRQLLLAPEINRWLRPPPLPPMRDEDPGLWLARDISHWQAHGFGPWVLRERSSGEFLGRAGLAHTTLRDRTAVELAWAILPSRWRQGHASEAARAALKAGEDLGFQELLAYTLPTNAASRGVMRKIGMRLSGEITHAGLPHLLYVADLDSRGARASP
jgi:[ribosomal protein S5]-alanine N-acetyltransferase